MKKFTKIAVVISAVLIVVGLICLVVSFGLGFTGRDFANMVDSGKFNFAIDNGVYVEGTKELVNEIENCRNLDIEIGAGSLELYYEDVKGIQVRQEDVRGFECYVEGDTLHIESEDAFGIQSSNGEIVLVIPKDMQFREVDLEIGAGMAQMEGLVADTINIEVGAGEADITDLDIKNLSAETRAGQLCLEMVDSEADYSYDIECGIGEIQLGKNSFSGLGSAQSVTNPGASRYMELECGIGQIQIVFQK